MALKIGDQVLGRFRITKFIAQGGFGAVYQAEDQLLGRVVAVKELLSEHATNSQVVARFFQEAKAAAKLEHPHVVSVYDVQNSQNSIYIVLEYMGGGSLSGAIEKEKRFSVARSSEIAIAVCQALQEAHNLGIVHRDIKPDNILFTKSGVVKVADFGIAHVPKAVGGVTAIGTMLGFQPGTLTYMSPEQIEGKSLDGRSDLYALGIVLYEMLTGEHYIDLSEIISVHQLNVAILSAKPLRPSELNPQVPAWMDSIVLKALEKHPSQRFTSVSEFGNAIKTGLLSNTNTVLPAVLPTTSSPAKKLWSNANAVLPRNPHGNLALQERLKSDANAALPNVSSPVRKLSSNANAVSLQEQITEDYKAAMKSGDATRKTTLSGLRAAFKSAEIDARGTDKIVDDTTYQAVIEKEAKKRRESIEEFTKANRTDLADKESAELEVLKTYLPEQMSDDELQAIVTEVVAQTGASSPKDMGKVMGVLVPRIAGRADGKLASKLVREALA